MNTESRLVVILLGGPGAGKGTQAEIVFSWLRLPHISTGQMLRSEIAKGTDIGKRIRTLVETGAFVDDATINALIANRIRLPDCREGFILDGYPRSVRQAVTFDKELRPKDRLVVIDLVTDLAGIIERLKRRGRCDDRENVIRPRLETYRRETIPVAEFYMQRGLYQKVDGMKPLEVVAESIAAILRKNFK